MRTEAHSHCPKANGFTLLLLFISVFKRVEDILEIITG